ncbi:MAG: bifunctional (p)ppGpp synthetase/guanosine-3',5'-bis(diphosphate) 3'-pyrophosphohydrolase [Deltaproteobacteria bacterium]|nr:bifunctional (p)ppGpp synthetase/guanosine-3',5'-bis(diphosphate) 3'-pyrophosphohydrolase [Deltaproteobacteria bacterium]
MHCWDPDAYSEAWYFATVAHKGQNYGGTKGGEQLPYINHVAEVAAEIMLALGSMPQLDNDVDGGLNGDLAVMCALLHDTLEDTKVVKHELVSRFGQDVADGVQALSKNETLPKEERMADSLRRIQKEPTEIWMVKMADRIVNLRQPPFYWSKEKAVEYREEAKTIYEALQKAHAGLADRLLQKIDDYQRFIKN